MQAEWIRLATSGPVVRRGLKFAVIVGAILIAINHGEAILRGDLAPERIVRMALTVVVPYAVSTLSSVGALRSTAARSGPSKMNLNQVTVLSSNVDVAARFYRALGLIQIVDASPRYVRFECPSGESTFSVHASDRLPDGCRATIYFECDDLDGTVRELKEQGLPFESDPQNQRWLWREAHLFDPDGNRLCLFRAGANRRHPPWRLTGEPA